MNNITHHAKVRQQQRCISGKVLDSLLTYGRTSYDHHGTMIVFFDHQARKHLRQNCQPEEYKKLETKLNAYAVIDSDGNVVTVGHRSQKINRH